MEFPRQEYWSGWLFPSPGDLPDPGIKPWFPAVQADSYLTGTLGRKGGGFIQFPKVEEESIRLALPDCLSWTSVLSDPQTGNHTIIPPGSQASRFRLEYTTSSPGAPACGLHIMGLCHLNNHMNKFFIINAFRYQQNWETFSLIVCWHSGSPIHRIICIISLSFKHTLKHFLWTTY